MKHPKQLTEIGITEKEARQTAKREGVSYKKIVQIYMEEWGKFWLAELNRTLAADLKRK
jgi:predicted acetyltransferase